MLLLTSSKTTTSSRYVKRWCPGVVASVWRPDAEVCPSISSISSPASIRCDSTSRWKFSSQSLGRAAASCVFPVIKPLLTIYSQMTERRPAACFRSLSCCYQYIAKWPISFRFQGKSVEMQLVSNSSNWKNLETSFDTVCWLTRNVTVWQSNFS